MTNTLHLVLKHNQFNKIVSDENISEYWNALNIRIKDYTTNNTVVFHKGNTNIIRNV